MKNKIFIYFFIFLFISCSLKQNLSTQLKHGLKRNPVKFLGHKAYESSRILLLEKMDDILLASDTLIIIENIVDVLTSYRAFVYDSNTQNIKGYKMQYDNKNPLNGELKEVRHTGSKATDILYSYQQGNIEEKIKEIRIIPAPVYLITIGIKKNNKFKFEYYRIYPWDSSFPSGKWSP